MVHVRLCLAILLSLQAILLLPLLSNCDEEDDIIQGINSFRQARNLPALTKNENANCLADEIADKLEDRPCSRVTGPSTISGTQPPYANYQDIIDHCKIDRNTTMDGVILPVCVPNRVPTLVLTNYTQSPYSMYLNNSRYAQFGIGKEDDWVVMVLTTNTVAGSFANAASTLVHEFLWVSQSVLLLLFGWLVVW